MWIDISHTVKVAELKGGRLMKNLDTGETRLEGEVVISHAHYALLDSAEQEYLKNKAPEPDAAELGLPVPEVEATITQSRKSKK